VDYVAVNSTLGLIRRNVNIRNSQVKQRAYTSLVRPILEYSSTVWDPYTSTAINKIEAVQRRAARVITSQYQRTASVTAMLAELNLQTLAERRRIARLTMFHKIHYRLVAVNMPLQLKQYTSLTRTENALAYHLPTSACDYHLFSFFPKTGQDWNSLPQEVVQLSTPGTFRSALQPTRL